MMNFLDDALVALALLASAGYVVATLGPATWRRALLSSMAAGTARLPAAFGMRRLAAALARGAAQAQRACGGCDTCGAQADSAVGASAAGDAAKSRSDALGHSNAEVRVPLSRIPRRRPG